MMMLMMMMMMTLMKLVNSATKFRHGIDKFYQPNSGLRSSRTWDEAIYTPKLDGFLANNIGELYRIVPKNSGFLLDP